MYPYRQPSFPHAQSWAQAAEGGYPGNGGDVPPDSDVGLSNSGWMIPSESDGRNPYGSTGGVGEHPGLNTNSHPVMNANDIRQEGPTPSGPSSYRGPSTASSSFAISQPNSRAPSPDVKTIPSLAQPPPQPRTLDELLVQFWTRQMDLAESGVSDHVDSGPSGGNNTNVGDEEIANAGPGPSTEEFKNFALPLARIKKVMKSDPDVKMISAEVPVLLSKACEIFIAELTCRAWLVAESFKRRTLQKSDVAAAIGYSDMFDFLIDIVPREEAVSKSELGHRKRNARYKEKREEERKAKKAKVDEEGDVGETGGSGVDEDASNVGQGYAM